MNTDQPVQDQGLLSSRTGLAVEQAPPVWAFVEL